MYASARPLASQILTAKFFLEEILSTPCQAEKPKSQARNPKQIPNQQKFQTPNDVRRWEFVVCRWGVCFDFRA